MAERLIYRIEDSLYSEQINILCGTRSHSCVITERVANTEATSLKCRQMLRNILKHLFEVCLYLLAAK